MIILSYTVELNRSQQRLTRLAATSNNLPLKPSLRRLRVSQYYRLKDL
jgi:hypothetical protein